MGVLFPFARREIQGTRPDQIDDRPRRELDLHLRALGEVRMSASSTRVPVTILYQVAPRSTRALPSRRVTAPISTAAPAPTETNVRRAAARRSQGFHWIGFRRRQWEPDLRRAGTMDESTDTRTRVAQASTRLFGSWLARGAEGQIRNDTSVEGSVLAGAGPLITSTRQH